MHKEDFFRDKINKLTLSQRRYIEDVYAQVLGVFTLDMDGLHGPRHWRRVLDFGTDLAHQTGVDLYLIQLFAVLHDSCRFDEDEDWQHGIRAACMCSELLARNNNHGLSLHQATQLTVALAGHTGTSPFNCTPDLTVGVCWDADRLDLGRVGCEPAPEKLFTVNSHYMIDACVQRSEIEEYGEESPFEWDFSEADIID